MTLLRILFSHNDWAREKLLELAAPLDDARLDRPFEIGLGSLRRTLHHLWLAERVWLDRWIEKAGARPGDDGSNVSVAELGDRFRRTADERDGFLDEGLDDAGSAGETTRISFTTFDGEPRTLPLGDMMLHVCNHGFHHRSQALYMLRSLGVKAKNLDYIFARMEPSPVPPATFDVATVAEYFRYGDWANARVREAAAAIGDADLDRTFEYGMGSLRKTLLHIQDAEAWWLENWLGRPSNGFQAADGDTPIDELRDRSAQTAARRNELLETHVSEELERIVTGKPSPDRELSFAMGDTMIQLCGHGTHHRAQAVNMLRRLDVETPALDYVVWFRGLQ